MQDTIATHNLIVPGDTIVVGVSGGPDSVCLLHTLVQLRKRYDLRLHAAHLNHGSRGSASDADAAFVAHLAADLDVPVVVETRAVPAIAEAHHLAFEEAARRVRYAFLMDVAAQVGATKIAVGHNADDQAETVLMHFIRGAGLAGLRGMLPDTPVTEYRLLDPFMDTAGVDRGAVHIIRPLLAVPRVAIEQYCETHGLTPRFDRSNLDTTYFRNWLRHDVLPLLQTHNPNIRQRLCHTARVVADDYALLVTLQERAWQDVVSDETQDAIVFDRESWCSLPVSLQRATLRHAAYHLRRSLRDVDFVHVELARQIALSGETGAQAVLPMGLVLTITYQTLRLGDQGDVGPPPDEPLLWGQETLPVAIPGETSLPDSAWQLQATLLQDWSLDRIKANPDPWTVYVDGADLLRQPVILRSRRPGDAFCPLGMGGQHVKLNEFFVNVKIAQSWRDHIPLVVVGDRIVWVAGRRVDERFRIGPETDGVIRLRFEEIF